MHAASKPERPKPPLPRPRERSSFETLPPGTRFGRYELIRRLAVGGMAELYLARASGIEGFEKIVVLKRILPQHAKHDDFVKMFLDEARLTASIQHANVAQVYDIGRCDDGLFFTMEYVHGEDVRSVMQTLVASRRGLPLEHALAIAIGSAAGLHAAHAMGIVHRDISPSNLLVSYDGCVKIIDFGIAKAARRETETRAGTLKGKIAYMSPEQCLGDHMDRRSDVFSLGIALYEMTTGQRLFPVENEYAAMRQIVDEDAPPPSTRKRGYPPELEAIVMRALRRRREERWGSAEEMQLALEQFVRMRGIAVSGAQLGYFMRDLFPERAADRPGGLTPPPDAARVILPLRAPAPATTMLPDAAVGKGTGPEPALAVSTAMFDAEPSISIDVAEAAPERRWPLVVAAVAAAAASAVIAAVVVMALLGAGSPGFGRGALAAPAARFAPVPLGPRIPAALPAAEAPSPAAAPAKRPRSINKKRSTPKKPPRKPAAWDPDSALPPT